MSFGRPFRACLWMLLVLGLQIQKSFFLTNPSEMHDAGHILPLLSPDATVNTISSTNGTSYVPTFIQISDLKSHDIFAAAWWMSRVRFQEANLSLIKTVEDDVFVPILQAGRGFSDARLTKNWLDFSIQHVSKWQKTMNSRSNNRHAQQFIQSFTLQQTQQEANSSTTNRSPYLRTNTMRSTLVMIVLGVPEKGDGGVREIWKEYLCATISSLLHHSPKRIVVVGHYEADRWIANQAFDFLQGNAGRQHENNLTKIPDITLRETEIGYVHVSIVKTKFIPKNIPYGALLGLQSEWMGSRQHPNVTQGSFFGELGSTGDDFKHLYFTEADQILLGGPAHHQALSSGKFLQELEQGRVLIPHRLQPLPHRDDWPNGFDGVRKSRFLFNRTHHSAPIENYDTDPTVSEMFSCCDVRPKQFYGAKTCASLWWTCGYRATRISGGNFSYFDGFDLFRPSPNHGIPIVTLAGNGHGRSCRMQRGACS